jgi:raffinose/stachyose/melibiose transport system permease protein/N-acetylglucosamine transport system permease protein
MIMGVPGKVLRFAARLVLYFWCAFSVLAFVWIAVSSLKTNREFFSNLWGLFKTAQWTNYVQIWSKYNLGTNFGNSLYVVSLSVILILVVCTPAAYVLSRIKFRFATPITLLVTIGMGVPFQLMLVPLYFTMFKIRMVNSLNGLILVYVALSIPFTVFLLLSFFKTLPSVLEEAAYIDGAGPMRTFFSVMLPLGWPGIVTAAIFNFISLWNEFLLSLTFLHDNALFTLPVGIFGLQTSMQYTGNWVALFAGFVIVFVPTLIIFVFLSRQIIEGLTLGAVKD